MSDYTPREGHYTSEAQKQGHHVDSAGYLRRNDGSHVHAGIYGGKLKNDGGFLVEDR